MELWVSIVSLLMISFDLTATNESLQRGANSDTKNRTQETTSRTARQRNQHLPWIHAASLQRGTSKKIAPGTLPPGDPTPATRICNADNRQPPTQRDKECQEQSGLVTPACTPELGYNYIVSAVATSFYEHMCPRLRCWYVTEPCPRNWARKTKGPFWASCNPQTGLGMRYHYTMDNLKVDTLFDLQSNVIEPDNQEYTLPLIRTHTCNLAKVVPNLHVEAYGLGWIYFVWRRPLENCYALLDYTEQYNDNDDSKNIFSQANVGSYLDGDGYTHHNEFHPCPRYPSWFCFIISENVVPFKTLTFKVLTQRFQGKDGDTSGWTTIEFTTDDKGLTFIFCPKANIFLTLWFLILLIVLLLLLLIIAAILLALIYKAKRDLERLEDDEGYEEEMLPPSNVFEKLWIRLRNFFNELCPAPKKPPPPPPPPPPKPKTPKPKMKPKPKPKPKKKQKPVPPPKKKEVSPSPPPPPPPPVPRPKKRRGARGDTGRDAAMLETQRMASGVGGVRARRRR